ncbi:PucR family transcriptional regulator [Streptomyces tagetis]|uniref:Helix-turn-helix domain-containing protein n=1 Tax=Streptomyces tagetis TaxID=2820809 RepID=A0A940XMM3_9ACTN|nr:helix-turn-helix domain-containing protein [Streptomyces sp. RG38]MBQ0827555.1 helix-turn-helix domain-containing protein [Streptomyces sp. RG38]
MTGRPRVADLLHDPVLHGVRTVAGAAGTERVVEDVRWYEGDLDDVDGHLLLCGEADVTPLYRLDALVRRAEEAGAAALLVIAGPARPLLSSVRLADRLRIPVLWLAEDHPVRLVQELTARVRAPQQDRARTVERLLRQLGTKRTGQEILAAAEAVLTARLSLVTSEGDAVLGDPVPPDPALRPERPVPQRGDHVLVHPVLDPDVHRVAAWLACPYERAAEARLETLAIGLAVTEPFLRSWLSAQRAQTVRDSVFQTQLLSEILTGGDSVSRDVVEGAVSLGWQLQGWHVGVHLVADPPGRAGARDPVVERFRAGLAAHGVEPAGAVHRGNGWALWTSTDTEPAPEDARATLDAVRRVIAALPRDRDLAAGIGRPHRGPGGLAETLAEARDAAELARSHDYRPAVEHSDELGVARLLATWQRSEVTRAFADTSLAPLRDPAHAHLLTTLRAYLESGGSVVLTAQALGVHRNTVTARLQQVRERLGVDLDDPSRRLALQVACRALGV